MKAASRSSILASSSFNVVASTVDGLRHLSRVKCTDCYRASLVLRMERLGYTATERVFEESSEDSLSVLHFGVKFI